MEVVRDDSIRIVGICGMGGVGKKAWQERSMRDGAKPHSHTASPTEEEKENQKNGRL
ncbi:hypothetical protein LguiB_013779 [Lonicera macranthoides]